MSTDKYSAMNNLAQSLYRSSLGASERQRRLFYHKDRVLLYFDAVRQSKIHWLLQVFAGAT